MALHDGKENSDDDTSEFKAFDYKKGQDSSDKKSSSPKKSDGLDEGTKALIAADSIDDDDDDDIEFSAKTEVIQLTGALKEQLKKSASSDDDDDDLYDDFDEDGVQRAVAAAQNKVKAHYKKRAKILEIEINRVIKMMKVSDPESQKKLLRIRKLLQLNTKGKPLRKKKK